MDAGGNGPVRGGGGGADLEDEEQRQDGGEAAETGGLTAPYAP